MADVQFTNFVLQSPNHAFSAIWKLSRALKKAGWIYLSSSDGSAKETSGTATLDKWGGAVDPASDTYPTALDTVNAWWNASGPTVVKIPFTAASTGFFLRGEKITQAISAAEGEIIGYEFDGVSVGHLVVMPRVGIFDNTHVITGASSSATLTPSGTIEFFVNEIVLFKSTDLLNGSIYTQRVSNQTENASRFSVLATSAGCTSIIAPGGGGTGNAFPTAGSWVMAGAQNSGSIVHANWFNITLNMGRAQIVATNISTGTGLSADGTWWILLGDTSSSIQTEFLGYFRLDNSEDGDIDPFVSFKATSNSWSLGTSMTTAATGQVTSGTSFLTGSTPNNLAWKGWRRRGFGTNDTYVPLTTAYLCYGNSNGPIITDNVASPELIANTYTAKRLREPIWIVSADDNKKIRKGTLRYGFQVQGGTAYDTWDNKTKICITASSSNTGSIIMGPYDGITTPLQS